MFVNSPALAIQKNKGRAVQLRAPHGHLDRFEDCPSRVAQLTHYTGRGVLIATDTRLANAPRPLSAGDHAPQCRQSCLDSGRSTALVIHQQYPLLLTGQPPLMPTPMTLGKIGTIRPIAPGPIPSAAGRRAIRRAHGPGDSLLSTRYAIIIMSLS